MTESQPDIAQLSDILDAVMSRSEKLNLCDDKIEKMAASEDIEEEITNALQYQDTVKEFRNKVERFIGLNSAANTSPPETFDNSCYPPVRVSHIKLPKMTLPEFDGDPLKWHSFWDRFESAVHINFNISDAEKMNYLKGFLKGNALRSIEGLVISNTNYITAVQILKERFGKKQLVINAYMDALMKIPPSGTDVWKLRNFL